MIMRSKEVLNCIFLLLNFYLGPVDLVFKIEILARDPKYEIKAQSATELCDKRYLKGITQNPP